MKLHSFFQNEKNNVHFETETNYGVQELKSLGV